MRKSIKQILNIDELWEKYFNASERGDGQFYRNKLVEYYRGLVKDRARILSYNLPDYLELDDLISSGIFGLIDAIESYDKSKHTKFKTHAYTRIKGSIIDELRNLDWTPNLVRFRQNQLTKANNKLESKLNRQPTNQELIKELSKEEYSPFYYSRGKVNPRRKAELVIEDNKNIKKIISFPDVENKESEDGLLEINCLKDFKAPNPAIEIEKRELKELLTKGLTRAEKLIISLYYYENMEMKEIGAIIGLNESRISQKHSDIIARLKSGLSAKRKVTLEEGLLSCIANHQQI